MRKYYYLTLKRGANEFFFGKSSDYGVVLNKFNDLVNARANQIIDPKLIEKKKLDLSKCYRFAIKEVEITRDNDSISSKVVIKSNFYGD